jgi:anaerobic magnesium-protoporphyrin IX monomethyl ester cyclase
MLGCLKAFAKTTVTKKFYDLERVKYKGLSAKIDLGFDESKVLTPEQIAELKRSRPDLSADVNFKGTPIKVLACGGPSDEQVEEQIEPSRARRGETGGTRDPATATAG